MFHRRLQRSVQRSSSGEIAGKLLINSSGSDTRTHMKSRAGGPQGCPRVLPSSQNWSDVQSTVFTVFVALMFAGTITI